MSIRKDVKELFRDLDDFELPKNFEVAYEKVKCPLIAGEMICWYYKDEEEFCKEEGEDIRECLYDISRGIVIPKPGISSSKELEIDDVVVVITSYPVEKDYPDIHWVALKRIIDDEDLREVFQPSKDSKHDQSSH